MKKHKLQYRGPFPEIAQLQYATARCGRFVQVKHIVSSWRGVRATKRCKQCVKSDT